MHKIVSDGAKLYFDRTGRAGGDPLLLLHGLTGTAGDWVHAFDWKALGAKFPLIAPDARGHGRSTNPSGAFTFRRCALDVLELLDSLAIERVRAVGMSLGAKTLLHVATEARERISAMVLVSATPRFPEATRALFRAAAGAEHAPDEWAAMRTRHVHGDAQIAALWQLPARFAEDAHDMSFTRERLAAIRARTLVIAGDRDPLYPVELAVELYRGISGSALYVVPGGSHGPIFGGEQPSFEHRVLEFFREP